MDSRDDRAPVKASNGLMYVAESDEALMARVIIREKQAFESLYERYGDLVYSIALYVTAEPRAAEDVAQEVFLRLWQRPASFDSERGRFVSWLTIVTRNRAVDVLRSRGRQRLRELAPIKGAEDPPDLHALDPALAAEIKNDQTVVRQALQTLPDDQRRAIELAFFRGLTQQEIASTLKVPLGTIKTRIRLGMQKMRVSLAGEMEIQS